MLKEKKQTTKTFKDNWKIKKTKHPFLLKKNGPPHIEKIKKKKTLKAGQEKKKRNEKGNAKPPGAKAPGEGMPDPVTRGLADEKQPACGDA